MFVCRLSFLATADDQHHQHQQSKFWDIGFVRARLAGNSYGVVLFWYEPRWLVCAQMESRQFDFSHWGQLTFPTVGQFDFSHSGTVDFSHFGTVDFSHCGTVDFSHWGQFDFSHCGTVDFSHFRGANLWVASDSVLLFFFFDG